MANRSFHYQQPFQFSEIELKGEKKYFIEGYISTTDPDLSNEVVTRDAQRDIVSQCLKHIITMDVEHEEFYKDGQVTGKPQNLRIPVAKIVEAELRDSGVWVKAEINQASDRFQNIWGSIKGGFLHSFSIAFYPLKAVTKNIGNQVLKFIDSLSLINVTLTGSPVNPNASFAPVMKAVMIGMSTVPEPKGETMSEEQPKPVDPAPVPAPVVEPTPAPAAPEVKAETFVSTKDFDAFKKDFDTMKQEVESMKAAKKDVDADDKDKAKDENAVPAVDQKDTSVLGGLNTNVKAQDPVVDVKALQAEIAELKAKLAEPVIKGFGPNGKPEDFAKQTQVPQMKSVLDAIR
jgi:phage head maturation protease